MRRIRWTYFDNPISPYKDNHTECLVCIIDIISCFSSITVTPLSPRLIAAASPILCNSKLQKPANSIIINTKSHSRLIKNRRNRTQVAPLLLNFQPHYPETLIGRPRMHASQTQTTPCIRLESTESEAKKFMQTYPQTLLSSIKASKIYAVLLFPKQTRTSSHIWCLLIASQDNKSFNKQILNLLMSKRYKILSRLLVFSFYHKSQYRTISARQLRSLARLSSKSKEVKSS